MTQVDRLKRYLEANPQASSLEIIRDLAVTNATGRISDLRDEAERSGTFRVVKAKRADHREGYSIEPVGPLTLFGDRVA